jgi:8-amino-7-oxononanoate synthase
VSWVSSADARLKTIRAENRWRELRSLDAKGPRGTIGGRAVVSFASNDYLGLGAHPAVIAAAHDALDRWGAGAGAARLIVGNRPVHDELESELANWKATDRAVLFPTGFMANLGVLSVFGGPDVTVVSDELNHASIIDGCRLSRSMVRVFRHGDLDHCESLVLAAPGRSIVVTDSVFSMDGDIAPLDEYAALCQKTGSLLIVDEAHAVLGPTLHTDTDRDVLRVGTLSKTLGSLGGFIAGPRPLIELLVNQARAFIFTTGSTPADTAAALQALRVLRSAEGIELRERLWKIVQRVRPGHSSPIVPIVIGDECDTMAAADALLTRGIVVPAIRPPTVPPGTSRLRVALSAAHTHEEIDRLLRVLASISAAP